MRVWILLALFLLVFHLSGNKICSGYSGGLDSQEATRLAELRSEALNGDHSHIDALKAIVRKPLGTNPNTYGASVDDLLVRTALRALTRLQVTDAVPDVDALINLTSDKYPDLADFAKVQRARLQAEAGVAGMTGDTGKTRDYIEAFYKALSLTPADINAGARLYKQRFYADANGRYLPRPVEVYALREIADMIYHGSFQEVAALPDVTALEFSLDPPSALKMSLASFQKGDRADKIVNKIVSGQSSLQIQDYELQLLVDEGTLAGSAIAHTFASLEQQAESEQKNQQRKRLAALFRELSAIGGQAQVPFIKQYSTDPDSTVQDEARTALQKIASGSKNIFPVAVGF